MPVNIFNLNKQLYYKLKNCSSVDELLKISAIIKQLKLKIIDTTQQLTGQAYLSYGNNKALLAAASALSIDTKNQVWQVGRFSATNSSPVKPAASYFNSWSTISTGIWHVPVALNGINNHVVAISSVDNTAWSWGYNGFGQLGINNATSITTPTIVVGGFTWKQVSAGYNFTTAIKSDDTIWTWGRNQFGQLGNNDGTVSSRSSPVSVVGGFTWKQVSAGGYHCAAIKSDDTLWTWGRNQSGQLGNNDGTVSSSSSPVSVVGGFTWSRCAAGLAFTNGIIKTTTKIMSFGARNVGQLGDNTAGGSTSSPVNLASSRTWSFLSAGTVHALAISEADSTLWGWGSNNYGQLGDNTATGRNSPVLVVGGFTWKHASAGYRYSVAIKTDGTTWSWGKNSYGQLGDNSATNRSSPVSVVGGLKTSMVSCGTSLTNFILDGEMP